MRIVALISLLFCYLTVTAQTINITNVTPASVIPPGSYALGLTGQTTRLLPVSLLIGSQVWTNDGTYTTPSTGTNSFSIVNKNGGILSGKGVSKADGGAFYDTSTEFIPLAGFSLVQSNGLSTTRSDLGVIFDWDKSIQGYLDYSATATAVAQDSDLILRADSTNVTLLVSLGAEIYSGGTNCFVKVNAFSTTYPEVGMRAGSDTTNALYVGTSFIVNRTGAVYAASYRGLLGSTPANVGGITQNLTVVTNGVSTATMHFTNGILMSITAP